MNEEQGTVKEVRGKKAIVVTDRGTMCNHCSAKGFCSTLGGGKEMLSEVRNPIGAQSGDIVKVGIPEGMVTKASLVVYMIPMIGLVGGASLGYFAAKLHSFDLNIATLIGGLVGLGSAMALVRLLSNVLSRKPSYQPEIIKIINQKNLVSEQCGQQ